MFLWYKHFVILSEGNTNDEWNNISMFLKIWYEYMCQK